MLHFISSSIAYWNRMWLVWRKSLLTSMTTNVVNPLLFLFAFGFGLGAVVKEMDGLPYFMYVAPGMIAQSAMFAATFETTIEAYFRFSRQKTWEAIMATPVSLNALLAGEVLWASTKALLAGGCVLIVAFAFGGIHAGPMLPVVLLLMILGAVCFACCGIFFVSIAKDMSFFSYIFTFWITPMFMFCGVLFPADRFPDYVQWIGWLLPMRHLIEILRPVSAGISVDIFTFILHFSYLLILSLAAFYLGAKRIRARMFD